MLVAVARRVAGQLRAGDLLGRWGGEEFVAVLPGAPSERVEGSLRASPMPAARAQAVRRSVSSMQR